MQIFHVHLFLSLISSISYFYHIFSQLVLPSSIYLNLPLSNYFFLPSTIISQSFRPFHSFSSANLSLNIITSHFFQSFHNPSSLIFNPDTFQKTHSRFSFFLSRFQSLHSVSLLFYKPHHYFFSSCIHYPNLIPTISPPPPHIPIQPITARPYSPKYILYLPIHTLHSFLLSNHALCSINLFFFLYIMFSLTHSVLPSCAFLSSLHTHTHLCQIFSD